MIVTIDPLTPADADRCAELEQVLFRGDDPWTPSAFLSELRTPGRTYVAARTGGALVGYGGLGIVAGPPQAEAEIHNLAVDPQHQGRGVGRTLLRALLDVADAVSAVVFLEVRTDNEPAKRLYESEGFAVVGLRRRYYRSGADAHTMRREAKS
ncbi:ribosomal-protein-alanine N-acetyltransferase [Pseudonocardia thermophila]|jgi:ribosomal-protein-alanine acetyltransferase|uniref:[Ribosomal protein bS18]-alanine N-acetyltransferase n=1 Tax=Pseudonocardia thermophila TaxID=1848 RepID=A0A1M6X3R5_PSETH|nr:ribosomal protein S18-alanine N-acetyltransferase [Pseudonocardia thermophila]SHL00546.1 ribosomal-protein-alanine N-acetyltransferase [Pseudonocardia thermophila]